MWNDHDALGIQVGPERVLQLIHALAAQIAILNQGKARADVLIQQLRAAVRVEKSRLRQHGPGAQVAGLTLG